MKNINVGKEELIDLLGRAQQFASNISIYSGKDLDELSLYQLEAASLRDKIYKYISKLMSTE
jgi:hypothetical protein